MNILFADTRMHDFHFLKDIIEKSIYLKGNETCGTKQTIGFLQIYEPVIVVTNLREEDGERGTDLIKAMKAESPETFILTQGEKNQEQKALEAGADEFMEWIWGDEEKICHLIDKVLAERIPDYKPIYIHSN